MRLNINRPNPRTATSLLGAVALTMACPALAQGGSADLLLLNGRVYAQSGWEQAIAVKDGTITAVGTNAEIEALRWSGSTVIDLGGKTVFPGLHDMHAHPVLAGLNQQGCQTPHGPVAAIVRAIADCVARAQPGEWISANAFLLEALGGPASRADLDAVSPDNPVVISDVGTHSIWANTQALRLAGLLDGGPAIENVAYDQEGQPTGFLSEQATQLVGRLLPQPRLDQVEAGAKWALDQLAARGFTHVTDAAGSGPPSTGLYAGLAASGALNVRVRLCNQLPPPPDRDAVVAALATLDPTVVKGWVTQDCIKIFVDGDPFSARTAAMIDPYLPRDGRTGGHGTFATSPADLLALVPRLDAAGYTVKMHVMGDAAAQAALDAVAQARKTNGSKGERHELAHADLMQDADIARARDLGATLEFSPVSLYLPEIVDDAAAQVGAERAATFGPVRRALDIGVLAVAGSDWPASFLDPDPWAEIELLVTRQKPGAAAAPNISEGQRIALREAIDMFTVNAARQLGPDYSGGVIAPGHLADFAIVDRNPFDLAEDRIHTVRNVMTIVDGKVTYAAD